MDRLNPEPDLVSLAAKNPNPATCHADGDCPSLSPSNALINSEENEGIALLQSRDVFWTFICSNLESESKVASCDTMRMCIITVLNWGLRNGGGIGDVLRNVGPDVNY